MQRKLSEIAEIPKILSSTLATVSQTFEILKSTDLPQQKQKELLQYQQQRKLSYDEDALDYELTDANATDDCLKLKAKGLKSAKMAKGKAKSKNASSAGGAKKSHEAKDATPESDYASEGNYEINDADTDADYGDDNGDNDAGSDVNNNRRNVRRISGTSDDGSVERCSDQDNYEKQYNFTLRSMALAGLDSSDDDDDVEGEPKYAYITRMRPTKSKPHKKQTAGSGGTTTTENEESDDDNDENSNEEDSDEDAVTVRFVATECESEDETDDDENAEIDEDDEDFLTTTYTWSLRKIPKLPLNDESQSFDKDNTVKDDTDDTDEEEPNKKARWCHGYDDSQDDEHQATQWSEEEGAKEKKFYEKSEHFWPWADREKIIYKQSTCHLVRRRPLGLVEQRIKLLAKQNLGDSLERQLQSK